MIAWRAVELECSGIVCATFPEIADWYMRPGAEQRCPKGWNHEKGLLPIVFRQELVELLKEKMDELFEVTP